MENRKTSFVLVDDELDSILGTISKQNQQFSEISKVFSESAVRHGYTSPDSEMFFGFPDEWNHQDSKTGFVPIYNGHHHHNNIISNGSSVGGHHGVHIGGNVQSSIADIGYNQPHNFSPYSDRTGQSPVDYSTEYQRSTSCEPANSSPSRESLSSSQSPPNSLNSEPRSFTPTQFPFQPEFWFEDSGRGGPGTKCQVCGEPAGKHCAYGGRVCPSCRAFFRRSVQTKYFEIFSCSKNESCVINLATRKSCKYCRFKKCLQARMQISWVLSEHERDRRFNKLKKISYRNNLIPQVKQEPDTIAYPEQTSSPDKEIHPLSLLHTPEIQFTAEEHLRVENWKNYIKEMRRDKYMNFFASEQECLQHLAHVSYFGGSLIYEEWKKFSDAGDQFAQEILMSIDTMQRLPVADRHALIIANGLVNYSYVESVCIDEVDNSLCLHIKDATLSGRFPLLKGVVDILERLGMKDKDPILRYHQVYVSPWASNLEDEDRHKTLIRRMKSWAKLPPNSKSSHDANLASLLRFIITFSPDLVELQRKDICEKILHDYCMMLYRYTKKLYGVNGYAKFAEAMAICADAREAAEILRRRLPV